MQHESDFEFAYLPAKSLTLKQVREVYNLTQNEVAAIIGCTQSNISKIDGKLVSLNHLVKISELFDKGVNISLVSTIRVEIKK